MRSWIGSLRAVALFVGSIVGAGFATGAEVRLFFGNDGVGSLVVASLFMALCAFSFMEIGARRAMSARVKLATDTVVSISSLAVYAAMIAASEEVLCVLTGQAGLSLFLTVVVSVIAGKGSERLSSLNLVAVPFMIAIILWVGARAGGNVRGGCRWLSAAAYGGMNLLFSGALMTQEGERIPLSARIAASILSGLAIFVMLYYMRRCATGWSDMPFLEAADREGLGIFARISLLLAIVTTMGSCAYLSIDRLTAFTGDRLLAGGVVTLVGILLSACGFSAIVRLTYPLISYLGLVATLVALVYFCYTLCRRRMAKISAKKMLSGVKRW